MAKTTPTWGDYLLVGVGGAAGTALRAVIASDVPGTLLVNLAGAFLLGVLTGVVSGVLGVRGARVRLLLGAGFLGGFTTWSSLILQVHTGGLGAGSRETVGAGLLYALVSVFGGLAAAWCGLRVGGLTGGCADRLAAGGE